MFRVEAEKGDLRFSAAHFVSFPGKCERLHGQDCAVLFFRGLPVTGNG